MIDFLTTPVDTGIPNGPTELTAALGRELVRLVLGNEQPPDMCRDCAFRLGSEPNQSYTAFDALKCVVEGIEFECHHGEERRCAGFARAIERNNK